MVDIVVEDGTGIVTANAYASVEEVDDIMSYRRGSAWNNLTDETEKEGLIIWATNLLDYKARWYGKKTHETQGLEWPRTGFTNSGGGGCGSPSGSIDDNVVPKQVKEVVAILANLLIDGDPQAPDSSSKITMVQADVVIVKFDPYAPSYKFPDGISDMLRGLARISMGRGGPKFIVRY